ncbi:phytanoyl-CoA dioxygenase family protein [Ralstonia pseudosolanacearum]
MPVAERIDDPALQGWSEKEGRLYVQPPRQVLEALIAVRLHLDDCGATAGPLRVVPGSHRQGRLTQAQMLAERERRGEVACLSDRGGVLLMRPLLLHASSRSTGALSRRVLHFVFGPRTLPLGLRWAQAV